MLVILSLLITSAQAQYYTGVYSAPTIYVPPTPVYGGTNAPVTTTTQCYPTAFGGMKCVSR